MAHASLLRLASLGCLVVVSAAACDAVLGISPGVGEGGSGGHAGTTSTTGAGGTDGGLGCDPYAGDGTVSWSASGSSDVNPGAYEPGTSVGGSFDPDSQVTTIGFGAGPDGFWCNIGTTLSFSGKPVAGQSYTLVDADAFADTLTFAQGTHAYVELEITEFTGTGGHDCNDADPPIVYGSVAGAAGATVTVDKVEGLTVAFTLTSVQLVPRKDPGNQGSATVTLNAKVHADCFPPP